MVKKLKRGGSGGQIVWTTQADDYLRASLKKPGGACEKIAKTLGVGRSSVEKRAREIGAPYGRERDGFWTAARIQKLKELKAAGKTFCEIGAILGCSHNAANGAYDRYGASELDTGQRAARLRLWTDRDLLRLMELKEPRDGSRPKPDAEIAKELNVPPQIVAEKYAAILADMEKAGWA